MYAYWLSWWLTASMLSGTLRQVLRRSLRTVFRMPTEEPSLAFQLPAVAAKGKCHVCAVGNVGGSTCVVVALSWLIASVD